MVSQVDASTVSAGAFFSESKLFVPDYQRRYSWEAKTQIDEFWNDLSNAIGGSEYFLGLVVLADAPNRQEIVDGQQRLVTLAVLANALRIVAIEHGRKLVAESLRTDFLWAMNFETEAQVSRIKLTDESDRTALISLSAASSAEAIELTTDSAIYGAHSRLIGHLREDLRKHENPELRIGKWSEFITKNVTFAVFRHPDRGAAFRVYEVINTRGKVLTPSELIKSYVIGTNQDDRDATYRRWNSIEEQLDAVGAIDQLTTFVRHVVTLDHGYVIPRELYAVVTGKYADAEGVKILLDRLDQFLPTYIQMLDPSVDIDSSEARMRAFILADALSLTRFRPILLAASVADNADELFDEILKILIPGVLAGAFGTGGAEAIFARAARRLNQGEPWDSELLRLRDLRPSVEEFRVRVTRGLNKSQAQVIRSAYLQSDRTPALEGFPHLVRARKAEGWTDFSEEQFNTVGAFVGNWILTDMERRPPGARTPEGVVAKIIPRLLKAEEQPDIENWTAHHVQEETARIIDGAAELWYGA